mmetsp:Transcript_4971/g.20327  ORF Transcript_4971/g.20327 Transcript_4971/m.20327 type:complete len:119 (-) Transcript_4971:2096-2452(-)
MRRTHLQQLYARGRSCQTNNCKNYLSVLYLGYCQGRRHSANHSRNETAHVFKVMQTQFTLCKHFCDNARGCDYMLAQTYRIQTWIRRNSSPSCTEPSCSRHKGHQLGAKFSTTQKLTS